MNPTHLHNRPMELRRRQSAGRWLFARASRQASQRGTAMVEMVLSMIILLTMLFGIMSCALMLFAYNTVSHAANEGARYAIVHGFGSSTPATAADIQSYVKQKAPGLNPDASVFAITPNWCVSFNTTCSGTPSATNSAAGNVVKVNVQYTFNWILSMIPIPPVVLSSTSQMVISQ